MNQIVTNPHTRRWDFTAIDDRLNADVEEAFERSHKQTTERFTLNTFQTVLVIIIFMSIGFCIFKYFYVKSYTPTNYASSYE